MSESEERAPETAVMATVLEQLPNLTYRVELENQERVLAHADSAVKRNFVRLRPGDRVRVAISSHDRTRGRIVELLRKG